jgi:hypothetical protein
LYRIASHFNVPVNSKQADNFSSFLKKCEEDWNKTTTAGDDE